MSVGSDSECPGRGFADLRGWYPCRCSVMPALAVIWAEAAGCRLGENEFMRPRGTSPRFVGRVVELSLLGELVDEARAGSPVTVIICGEAGVGKSRLVAEVTAAARDQGTLTLAGSCSAVGRTSFAFAPFAEALRPLARELTPAGGDSSGGRVAPRLFRLVSGSAEAEQTRKPPGPDPLGASAQLGLFEEVLDTLEDAAVPSGVLVVIEDLHWADQSSRGMFDFLSRNLRGTAVALVGTVRVDEPDEAGLLAWLAEVQRGPRAIRIDLEPFSREELTDLVAGVLGEPAPVELATRVYERSGGNAFLAEELLAAAERGALVPAGVRSLVLARMAVLSGPARGLLRLAAVVGASARHGLLAAAGDLGAEDLLGAARELVENHLLVADPSGDGYAFRHALTREAVYAELLPGERQQLHRAVARALTDEPTLGPPAQWAATEAVAEHWYAAGELEHALAASVLAGSAARKCSRRRAHSVTTSGRWLCGTGWPTPRRSPASSDPSCSSVRRTSPAGPASTIAPSATSMPPSQSCRGPTPLGRCWVCCVDGRADYLWRAGRVSRVSGVDWARR